VGAGTGDPAAVGGIGLRAAIRDAKAWSWTCAGLQRLGAPWWLIGMELWDRGGELAGLNLKLNLPGPEK
jgi:hypothetical protein